MSRKQKSVIYKAFIKSGSDFGPKKQNNNLDAFISLLTQFHIEPIQIIESRIVAFKAPIELLFELRNSKSITMITEEYSN
jgi:hypothetical protein